MSKKAAGRGRALLEVLGFDTADIDSFYEDNPRKGENAVQAGLLEWVGRPPPKTWKVLIDAMGDAGIAQQHTEGLKERLQKGVCVCVWMCMYLCVCTSPKCGLCSLTSVFIARCHIECVTSDHDVCCVPSVYLSFSVLSFAHGRWTCSQGCG